MHLLLVLLVLCTHLAASPGTVELIEIAADADRTGEQRMAAFEEAVDQARPTDVIPLAQDSSADARMRWVAIRVLGNLGSPPAVEALVDLLDDDRSGMRAAACAALADAGARQHAEKVAGLLEDPAVIVRAAAADALGELGDIRTVAYLDRALQDPSNHYRGSSLWVRRHYVEALADIGHPEALGPLVRSLHDEDSAVVEAALTALQEINGFSYAEGRTREERIQAWCRWWMNRREQDGSLSD